jgi:hypothetical protein
LSHVYSETIQKRDVSVELSKEYCESELLRLRLAVAVDFLSRFPPTYDVRSYKKSTDVGGNLLVGGETGYVLLSTSENVFPSLRESKPSNRDSCLFKVMYGGIFLVLVRFHVQRVLAIPNQRCWSLGQCLSF